MKIATGAAMGSSLLVAQDADKSEGFFEELNSSEDSKDNSGFEWAGSDFRRGPRPDGGVALCGACTRTGHCQLGLTKEWLDDKWVAHSRLSCPEDHEGGPGVAHGGWTAGVLDELLGHVPLLHGQLAVTARMEVIFLRPVPIERELEARAWVDRREGSRWHVVGEICLASTGAQLATASGVWVERDRGHFDRHRRWLAEQDEASR